MSDEYGDRERMGHAIYYNCGDIGGYRSRHRFADRVDDMTDQQAPEWIIKILRNHAEDPMWADHCEMHKTVAAKAADLLEAAEKQRDEMAAEVELQREITRCERLLTQDLKAALEIKNSRAEKAEAEVERLREALEKAARALEYTHYLGDAKTARSALQRKEGNE